MAEGQVEHGGGIQHVHGGFEQLAAEWGEMPTRHRGASLPEGYWENGRLVAERCAREMPCEDYPTIAELGCGHGRMATWLARKYEHVYAVDIAQGMLDAFEAPANATKVLDDGTHLVEKVGQVHGLFSFLVLMHNRHEDVARIMVEVGRVLVPGGRALIHLPLGEEPAEAADWSRVGRWTVDQLHEFVAVAGLEPTIVRGGSASSREALRDDRFADVHVLDKPAGSG